nr:5920_t:CDS:2 [Entrophospora candida]
MIIFNCQLVLVNKKGVLIEEGVASEDNNHHHCYPQLPFLFFLFLTSYETVPIGSANPISCISSAPSRQTNFNSKLYNVKALYRHEYIEFLSQNMEEGVEDNMISVIGNENANVLSVPV